MNKYKILLVKKFMPLVATLLLTFMIAVPGFVGMQQLVGGTAMADAFKTDACNGLKSVNSAQDCGSGNSDINKIIAVVVNILSILAGALAVIFIIVAGFRYISSGGEASKVASAKSALIYALIGIAVAALAQLLVHAVINTAQKALS